MTKSTLTFYGLRALAFAGAFVYLGWNICWWTMGHLAPSLSLSLFGIPAPTTGMTRSLRALGEGQWLHSLQWNPFSLLFLALFFATLAVVLVQSKRGNRLSLPPCMVYAWGGLLIIAWLYKLIQGPTWW